jgi:hypothetical protein
MKKIILTNGLIAGVIVSIMFPITWPLMEKGILNFDNGMIFGYGSMLIAFSMIFFGVKTFRDQHQGGVITFGKAFQIGILITVIASVMYALSWEVCYHTIATDFTEKYTTRYLDKMAEEGATSVEIAAKKTEMENFNEMYKNPIVRFAFTAGMEIFPVGLLITLISAALFRKRKFLPETSKA